MLESVHLEILRHDAGLVGIEERGRVLDVVVHLLRAGEADVVHIPAELELMIATLARPQITQRLRRLISLADLIGAAAERRAGLQEPGAQQQEQRLRPLVLLQVVAGLAANVVGRGLEEHRLPEHCRLAQHHAGRRLRARGGGARKRDRAGHRRPDHAVVVERAAIERRRETIRLIQVRVGLRESREAVVFRRHAEVFDVRRRRDAVQRERRNLAQIEVDAARFIQLLERAEEKELVFDNRPSARAAPLVAFELRRLRRHVVRRQRRRRRDVRRIEPVVAREPERAAVHLVGARAGDDIGDAALSAAEFGLVAGSDDLEFLY